MSNSTFQSSSDNNSIPNSNDRTNYIGTLYAIIAGLSFLLFSIISFLICHPPFRKEIRRLFSSKPPHSNQQTSDEIDPEGSNITYCGSPTNKYSRELKCIQTDQPTLMNPLTYTLPSLASASSANQCPISPESPISTLMFNSPLKTPLPIKTQSTQPTLTNQISNHQSIPNLRHPHKPSSILKNAQSHYNHLRSTSSSHELKSFRPDYSSSHQIDSNYLSASLPPINNRSRFSLYDFNYHPNETVPEHQVRSRSTPLEINPHQCSCKPTNRVSTSTFIAPPIALQDEEIYHHEGQEHGLSHEEGLMSNEDLYSLNSCQVFPAGSDSASINQSPNTIDHLVMSSKTPVNKDQDDVSLESNEFYRGRTRSRPNTIINS